MFRVTRLHSEVLPVVARDVQVRVEDPAARLRLDLAPVRDEVSERDGAGLDQVSAVHVRHEHLPRSGGIFMDEGSQPDLANVVA